MRVRVRVRLRVWVRVRVRVRTIQTFIFILWERSKDMAGFNTTF